jgi:hypothetical protein
MAHYAFLNQENFVVEVITGRNEDEIVDGIADWEQYYGNFRNQKCVRTSYNKSIRKNFAGIGFSYNAQLDAFIPPKCHEEATLDEDVCQWVCNDNSHIIIEGSI